MPKAVTRAMEPRPLSPKPAPHHQPADLQAQRLGRRIRAHLVTSQLRLILTDNRYTMISVRRERDGSRQRLFRVRLHHMFCDAPPAVVRALALYISRECSTSSKVLGDFIDANQHHVRTRTSRRLRQRLITAGAVHDLQDIFDDLNERYFAGRISAKITWGQRTGKPRRRNTIKMGSYSMEDRLIRMHRSLDRAFVPRFFVEWIVYHEMLHQVHGVKTVNGRRQFHSKEFLADESRFEHYELARRWEYDNLDALLTY